MSVTVAVTLMSLAGRNIVSLTKTGGSHDSRSIEGPRLSRLIGTASSAHGHASLKISLAGNLPTSALAE